MTRSTRNTASPLGIENGPVTSAAGEVELPDLPGFDTAEGLARVGGNRSLYLRLLRKLRDEYMGAADDVDSALAAGDWERALHVVHTLQGVAGNLGASELHRRAADLQAVLKGDDDGELGAANQAFHDALDAAAEALARLRSPQTGASAVVDHPEGGLPDALLSLLARLDGELAMARVSGCRSVVEELRTLPWPEGLRADLGDLAQLVARYRFEEAQGLVARMSQAIGAGPAGDP